MIKHLDIYIFYLINGFTGHWFVDCVVSLEENLFLVKGVLILAIYTWLWFEGQGARRNAQRETIVAMILSSFVAIFVARTLANVLPFRGRPMYAGLAHFHAPSFHIGSDFEHWSSFPSDHAAIFFALALGIFFMWRRMGILLLAYVALFICLPKIYLGIHYPSDIAVGTVIGLASAWLFFRAKSNILFRRWITSPVLELERKFPNLFYPLWFMFLFEIGLLFSDVRFVARRLFLMFRFAPEKTALLLFCVAIVVVCVGMLFWRRLRSQQVPGQGANLPERD